MVLEKVGRNLQDLEIEWLLGGGEDNGTCTGLNGGVPTKYIHVLIPDLIWKKMSL